MIANAIRLIVIMLAGALAACAPNAKRGDIGMSLEERRARAATPFDRASFLKPNPEQEAHLAYALAPLLVWRELSSADGVVARARCGAFAWDEAGRATVDPATPAVYTGSSSTMIYGIPREQRVYVWLLSTAPRAADPHGPRWHGLRITLGADGFPVIWEVLTDGSDVTLVFVSQSLERAAIDEFGALLPDRRYAVERPVGESGAVAVVGVLDDGPIPMGPMVYVDPEADAVTTVLCRCMPAQVNQIVDTAYYDLLTIEDLPRGGKVAPFADGLFPSFPGSPRSSLMLEMSAPDWLERVLRLPADF